MDFFSRFVALLVFLLITPLLLFIVLLLFVFQGRPIFFYHKRVGFNFKKFNLIKFRTMIENDEKIDVTLLGDIRITYLGKILRFFKIDELPQLINIIKGDMRFIGPRPEVEKYVFKNQFNFLKKVKPGLSDFSSIIFRNEETILVVLNNKNSYKNILLPIKINLGQLYAKNKSFSLDFLLVLLTIVSIFSSTYINNYLLNHLIYNYDPYIAKEIKNILEKVKC